MSMIKDQWVGRQKLAIEHPLMHQRIPFEKRITHRSMVDERTVERLDLLEIVFGKKEEKREKRSTCVRLRGLKIYSHNPSPARHNSQLANGSSVWINCYAVREERHIHVSTSVQQASCARQSIARLPCYFTVRLLASHLASR
ncbi:hypothetical protein KCU70_g311, partial [Aureobasidium melanogenum]